MNKDKKLLAEEHVSRARSILVLGKKPISAFFARLALQLEVEVTSRVPTAATDGRRLLVNPDWFCGLDVKEQVGVICHEVMHLALQHHARMGHRDPFLWNVAGDVAINPIILDAGMSLPSGRLLPGYGICKGLPWNKSAEEYYEILKKDQKQSGGPAEGELGAGEYGVDPGDCGSVMPASDPRASEDEWRAHVASALQAAKMRGDVPGSLQRLVSEVLYPSVDWRSELSEFVQTTSRNDYSWARPNKRFIHSGLYLPSLISDELGDIVISVDVSGSITQRIYSEFAGECQGILDAYDCKAWIVYSDCAIQNVQIWRSSDGPLTFESRGGGGTSHVPVWNWLKESEVTPRCIICLTDGDTDFGEDPGVPVLWALTKDKEVPFGRKVIIK